MKDRLTLTDGDGLTKRLAFLDSLLAQGGPEPDQYDALTQWVTGLSSDIESKHIPKSTVDRLIKDYTEQFFVGTLQCAALSKPHGYAGDYEIIDAIYLEQINPDPRLCRWDRYFHAQAAPKAVRNRKDYFQRTLHGACKRIGYSPLRS